MKKRLKAFALRAILGVAPFLFMACEKSTGEIGLSNVIDSQAVLGTKQNLPIISFSTSFDSVFSTVPGVSIAGSYIDPHLGGVRASINTHLQLSTLNPEFGENPICDSVVMLVSYRGYYGDTISPTTFVVKELGEYMDPDSAYYSNRIFALNNELGRITLSPRPTSPAHLEGDTLKPALKLYLDKDYFQENLINASRLSKQYFVNNTEYIKHMFGIQIQTEGYSDGLYYFNLNGTSSFLKVYYRETPADTVSKDYEMLYAHQFIDDDGQSKLFSVNTFSQDYTLGGPDFAFQDTVNGEQTVYSQAMGGAVANIILPNLKEFKDSNWIINKAEIIVPVREGSVGKYRLPSSILLLEDVGESRLLVDDYAPGSINVDGKLTLGELREKSYTFNITRLVHRYITTEDTIFPLILLPATSASQGWRAVLNGNADPVKPMEFNIYYTKTKD